MSQSPTRPASDLDDQFHRLFSLIFKYYRYRGADADTANDLASAVFERALRRLNTFDPRQASLTTWLFAIAHNLGVNHWKSNRRQPAAALEAAAPLAAEDPPLEEQRIRDEKRQELLAALQELDERQRQIVALKFAGFLTNRQIAQLTGLTESNVGVILYRALQKLRTKLTASLVEVSHE